MRKSRFHDQYPCEWLLYTKEMEAFIYCLVGCFSDRETGSMTALEAVLPEATAAEAVTSECVPGEATLPEATAAESVTPEATAAEAVTPEATAAEAVTPEVTVAETVTPEATAAEAVTAMTSEPDFRETLGYGRLEVVASRCRRQQRRVAERDRLRRCRLQNSQDAQEEAQGQTHRAEHSGDRYGDLLAGGCLLYHGRFLPPLSASCRLAATA